MRELHNLYSSPNIIRDKVREDEMGMAWCWEERNASSP
jgi:hypothetical protein